MEKTLKKGFTLIELLVVVLIIGILASVALPKYQKAVEKSKASTALPVLKNLRDAMELYILSKGAKANVNIIDRLDIDIPEESCAVYGSSLGGPQGGSGRNNCGRPVFMYVAAYGSSYYGDGDAKVGAYYMEQGGSYPHYLMEWKKVNGVWQFNCSTGPYNKYKYVCDSINATVNGKNN